MAADEAYMLCRNQEESQRLDAQHAFMRHLAYGRLIQPSIPLTGIRSIADVATGTGVWLREVAQELTSNEDIDLIGFDISAQQFPEAGIDGADLIVHDITKPFPQEHHERFDLVHVRLLSYALKEVDLETSVRNIIQILRPGGYLQWQEVDAIDSWAMPDSLNARSSVEYIISERMGRGLTTAIATPLVKALQSGSIPVPTGNLSPVSWSGDLLRILHLDTFSTMDHPSPIVQAGKKQGIKTTAIQLLQAGMSRRGALASRTGISAAEAHDLKEDVKILKDLLEAWNNGTDPACNDWNFAMTSIVARKAFIINEQEAWMTAKY